MVVFRHRLCLFLLNLLVTHIPPDRRAVDTVYIFVVIRSSVCALLLANDKVEVLVVEVIFPTVLDCLLDAFNNSAALSIRFKVLLILKFVSRNNCFPWEPYWSLCLFKLNFCASMVKLLFLGIRMISFLKP